MCFHKLKWHITVKDILPTKVNFKLLVLTETERSICVVFIEVQRQAKGEPTILIMNFFKQSILSTTVAF